MTLILWAALMYPVFGILLMTWLCPHWGILEKLVGAAIWPVSLCAIIAIAIREFCEERQTRAINYHTRFHLMSQLQYLDVLQGHRGGMWE